MSPASSAPRRGAAAAVQPGAEPFSADGGRVGYHVVTLDNDAPAIFQGTLAFIRQHSDHGRDQASNPAEKGV